MRKHSTLSLCLALLLVLMLCGSGCFPGQFPAPQPQTPPPVQTNGNKAPYQGHIGAASPNWQSADVGGG